MKRCPCGHSPLRILPPPGSLPGLFLLMLVHLLLRRHQAAPGTQCIISAILFLTALPMAHQFQLAEHLHYSFTHHSISYLAPLTTLITGEKSETLMKERLSDWLVALRHQTPRSFRRGKAVIASSHRRMT